MRSWKKPTPEQVDKAVSLLARREGRRYFFERLENPLWIEPLRKRSFFTKPPSIIHHEDRRTISFPPWPESRYLARMAGLDEGQEEVIASIVSMPATDNQQVHKDLATAASQLRPDLAAQLVDKAAEWIRAPYGQWLAQDFGALIVRLTETEGDDAFVLARVALELQLDKDRPADPDAPRFLRSPRGLRARYEPWHYQRLVRMLQPALAKADVQRALELWSGLLADATTLSRGDDTGPYDGSNIWRPSISKAAAYRKDDPEDALIDALTKTAWGVIDADHADWPTVLDILESHHWSVFRRIGLFLMMELDAPVEIIEPRIADREDFEDAVSRVEYGALLAKVFGSVSEACRQTILSWIEQGPDMEEDGQVFEHFHGRRRTDDELRQQRDHWKLRRLQPIASELTGAWRTRYGALVTEFRQPSEEASSSAVPTFVGPTSPLAKEDLAAMSIEKLLDFLSSWEPGTRWEGPSREDLQRVLKSVVSECPGPYADTAQEFCGQEATYVRGVLDGLTEATRNGKHFEWSPVLELASWVLDQQTQHRGEWTQAEERDPHWGWAIRAVASLVSCGLEQGPCEIPERLLDAVWAVIARLTEDPDPTPEHEAEFGGDNMDPTTLALNSVRGSAMNTLVRYALWRRRAEAGSDGEQRVAASFDAMPEVRDALNERLDPGIEPSVAVRSTYGRWFPWIVLLDATWATDNARRIFGVGEGDELGAAAWNTYLSYTAPYDSVLPILRERYSEACRLMGKTARPEPPENPRLLGEAPQHTEQEANLAQHLMTYYWRGALADAPGRQLLETFYRFALLGARTQAFEFLGRSLRNSEALDTEVRERLVALWEKRVDAVKQPGEGAELRAFGFWFASGLFEEPWAREQLATVLSRAGGIEHETDVAERLASMSPRAPLDVVELFRSLVDAATEEWAIHVWKKDLFEPLSIALSHDVEARDAAICLINRLGELGFFEFRSLLPEGG